MFWVLASLVTPISYLTNPKSGLKWPAVAQPNWLEGGFGGVQIVAFQGGPPVCALVVSDPKLAIPGSLRNGLTQIFRQREFGPNYSI